MKKLLIIALFLLTTNNFASSPEKKWFRTVTKITCLQCHETKNLRIYDWQHFDPEDRETLNRERLNMYCYYDCKPLGVDSPSAYHTNLLCQECVTTNILFINKICPLCSCKYKAPGYSMPGVQQHSESGKIFVHSKKSPNPRQLFIAQNSIVDDYYTTAQQITLSTKARVNTNLPIPIHGTIITPGYTEINLTHNPFLDVIHILPMSNTIPRKFLDLPTLQRLITITTKNHLAAISIAQLIREKNKAISELLTLLATARTEDLNQLKKIIDTFETEKKLVRRYPQLHKKITPLLDESFKPKPEASLLAQLNTGCLIFEETASTPEEAQELGKILKKYAMGAVTIHDTTVILNPLSSLALAHLANK